MKQKAENIENIIRREIKSLGKIKTIYLFNNIIHFVTFIYFQNQYNQIYKMLYYFNDNIWSF